METLTTGKNLYIVVAKFLSTHVDQNLNVYMVEGSSPGVPTISVSQLIKHVLLSGH